MGFGGSGAHHDYTVSEGRHRQRLRVERIRFPLEGPYDRQSERDSQ